MASSLGRLPLAAALLLALALAPAGAGAGPRDALLRADRLRLGIGDRLVLDRDGAMIPLERAAEKLELPIELVQFWLPRGWRDEWIPSGRLQQLARRGITPVAVHYFFGDDLSKERFEAQRDAWYTSLWRMAQHLRMDAPVLVVLEPEWNQPPPRGETDLREWPGFAEDLRAAARLIRREAPNALVGVCPGDFPGTPRLERVLGPVAPDLDFLAFQEMRASTEKERGVGYLDVGGAARDFAAYLQRAFGRPLLLAYVAVSSHGSGWPAAQAQALASLRRERAHLLRAGVFGAIYFQLFDDPQHRGYFGAAERHFGLVDARGVPKPALRIFRSLAR